jgi:hypothetical protein
VWHRIGKISTRATTLVETLSRLDFVVGSYELPKSRDSNRDNFESPGKKSHLDVASAQSCRVYYKGEGGGLPQVQAVVSLVCPCCPWLVLTPKVLQLCINHFMWVVCKPMWVSEACQLFLVPSRNSNTPLYPSKCCELGSVPRLLLFRCFLLKPIFGSFEELGVRHKMLCKKLRKVIKRLGKLVKL